jgi:hypothetical protein
MGSWNEGIDSFGEGHPAGDEMPDRDVIEGIGAEIRLHQDREALDTGDVVASGSLTGEPMLQDPLNFRVFEWQVDRRQSGRKGRLNCDPQQARYRLACGMSGALSKTGCWNIAPTHVDEMLWYQCGQKQGQCHCHANSYAQARLPVICHKEDCTRQTLSMEA